MDEVKNYTGDGMPIISTADSEKSTGAADKSPVMTGRDVIYTDEVAVTAENVIRVLRDALPTFHSNQKEIQYLYGYYKGNQPILNRIKNVRPEIKNMIVENHAWEIVTFKVAYLLGAPITYTRRKTSDESRNDEIGQLNEIMHVLDKEAADHDIAEWNHICGTAYRYIVGSVNTGEGIDSGSCDPRRTAVIYSRELDARPVMAFQETVRDNAPVLYTCWTPNETFYISQDKIVRHEIHGVGYVPIIEYPLNNARVGAFEVVLTVLDAINTLSSNRLDGTEQFVQSFLKFVNCKIDKEKYQDFLELGAIYIQSDGLNPSDVDIVSSELDQTQAQVEIDHLYQQALIICGMPDRNGTNRASGDSGQAVILRDGWTMAESTARDTIMQWERSEKKFLRIALSLLKTLGRLDLSLSDVDIRFTKGNTENLLVKVQALSGLLAAGVAPMHVFPIVHLFDDPNQVCADSEKYLVKWLPASEPKAAEQGETGGNADGASQ